MFVGYMMMTKQYLLYNTKIRIFIKSQDGIFYKDILFFQQTGNKTFLLFTNESKEDAGPKTQSKATKSCSVMASARDSDSHNSGPSSNIPEGEKLNNLIQALQGVLEWSHSRRSLVLERKASMKGGSAYGYGTPVMHNQKKPPMTAAGKYEKTVNSPFTGLGQYWEGRGMIKSYKANKGKGKDDSESKSTSDTIVQAGAASKESEEVKDEDNKSFFKPNLVFMVNNGLNTTEEVLRGADKNHKIKVNKTELDSLEKNRTWGVIKHRGPPTKVRPISSWMVLQDKGEGERRCSLL